MELILALFFIWYMANTLPMTAPAHMFLTVLFIVLICVFTFGPVAVGHPLFGSYPSR